MGHDAHPYLNLVVFSLGPGFSGLSCLVMPSSEGEISDSSEDQPLSLDKDSYRRWTEKARARVCGHWTFPWDNHPSCLSCSVWSGKGQWQGLPCVDSSNLCFFCRFWRKELRDSYIEALQDRPSRPDLSSAGKKFLLQHDLNAPMELLNFLGLQPITAQDLGLVAHARGSGKPKTLSSRASSQPGMRVKAEKSVSSSPEAEGTSQPLVPPDPESKPPLSSAKADQGAHKRNISPRSPKKEVTLLIGSVSDSWKDAEPPGTESRDTGSSDTENPRLSVYERYYRQSSDYTQEVSTMESRDTETPRPRVSTMESRDTETLRPRVSTRESRDTETPSLRDPETPRLRDSETPRPRDSETPRIRDSETPRLRDSETPRHVVSRDTEREKGYALGSSKANLSNSQDRDSLFVSQGLKALGQTLSYSQGENTLDIPDSEEDFIRVDKVVSFKKGSPSKHKSSSKSKKVSQKLRVSHSSETKPRTLPESEGEQDPRPGISRTSSSKRVSSKRRHRSPSESSSESDFRSKHHKRRRIISSDSSPEPSRSKSGLPQKEDSEVFHIPKGDLAAFVEKVLSVQQSSTEEDLTRSFFTLWKAFRESVVDTHPEVPPPQRPKPTLRTLGGPTESLQENHRLPLFPSITSALQACEESILEPTSKAGTPQDPLGVGSYLKAQRPFSHKVLEVEGDTKLAPPLRRNTNWPKDVLEVDPARTKTASVPEADLKQQETDLRETLAVWSSLRWSFSTASKILENDSVSTDEVKDRLNTVFKLQDSLAPLIEDRLTTSLTNTILRRRDVILSSYQAKFLQEENIVDIRGSPLLGTELLEFPSQMIQEERDSRAQRALISALKRPPPSSSSSSSKTQYKQGRFQQSQQRQFTPAAAGSATQIPSASGQQKPYQPPAAAPTAYNVQYQPYKKRKGRSGNSRNWQPSRGRDSRPYRGNFSGSSYKGRGRGRYQH